MMRFSVQKRRRCSLGIVLLVIISMLVSSGFWLVESHLKPTLLTIAEAKATLFATQAINKVINETAVAGVDSASLVDIKVDSKGRVVFIQPNTMEFNRLAADTTIKVQNALKEITEETITIPAGQVFGSQLLASMGPRISITVIPVGTVQVKVVDTFEQAGINQTRHMIYLLATTQVKIVVPLVSKSVNVTTQVPIAEYVVVGEVPGTYVQVPLGNVGSLLSPAGNENTVKE